MSKRNLLRKRLSEPGIILSPGVYDCLSAKIAERTGFKLGVFALSGLFAATKAIEDCFLFLKENGTISGFENRSSFKDYEEIIDIKKYQELEKKFITRKPHS